MRYSNLPEPFVPQVKVPDMGAINSNALAGAVNMGRIQDMGYERGARNAYDNALAGGGNQVDGVRAMRQGGYASAADKYEMNWLNTEDAKMKYESGMRKAISDVLGTVMDEDSKNRALDYVKAKNPDFNDGMFRAMPWQQAKEKAVAFLPVAEQQRLGLAQAEEGRKSALFTGQLQGQSLDNQGKAQIIQQRTEEGPLRIAERDARLKKLQEEAAVLQSKAAQTHSNIQLKTDEYNSPEGSFVFGFNRQTGVPERWDPQSQSWQPFGVKADGPSEQAPQGGNTPEALKASVASGKVSRADAEKYARGMGWIR